MHAPGHDAAGRRADPERWAMLDAEAKAKRAAATGQAPVGGDLDSFAAELGLNTSGLAMTTGSVRDPFFGAAASDYPVLLKRGKGPTRFNVPTSASEFTNPRRVALQSQVLRDFYKMDPGSLSSLQQRLLAGGFYPGDVEPEDLSLGSHDEETLNAYSRAINRAAAFNEADEDVTLDEVIDRSIDSNAGKEKKGRSREPLVVELSDPEDVRRGVEAVARKVIGRKLSDAEREKYIALWHAVQSQTQTAKYVAGDSGGTVTQAPSFESFAAARIAKEYGAEAGAVDIANQGNEFMDLLREVGG